MRTLDRYLFREMLGPFMVALLGFIVLLVGHMLFTAITMVLKLGVPAEVVLRFVLLQVPSAAVMAFPVATMLAVALTFNRMIRDNEVPILRTGGVSLFRLLQPAAVGGLFVTVVTFAVNEGTCPWAARASGELVRASLRRPHVALRSGQFIDAGRGFRILATEVDRESGVVRDALVYWIRDREDPIVFWAKDAIAVDQGWHLRDVRIFAMARRPGPVGGHTPTVDIWLPGLLEGPWSAPPGLADMSFRELGQQIVRQRRLGGRTTTYELSYHRKLAAPFACLVFALLAGPITLRFRYGGSLVGVLLTFLAVLVYFILMLWFQALGQQGMIPPVLSAWAPNLLFGLGAIVLIATQP